MKINQNARTQSSQPSVSQAEVKKESVTSNENALRASTAVNVPSQKIAAEASGVENLKAGMLQKSLGNELSSRSEKWNKAATDLLPKVHTMINNSGEDPDKFISGVRDELITTNYAVLGNMAGADIEAIAFLVLMQAAKSAKEDLKAVMDGVKQINKSKQDWRELIEQARHHSKLKDDDD